MIESIVKKDGKYEKTVVETIEDFDLKKELSEIRSSILSAEKQITDLKAREKYLMSVE